MSTMLDQFDRVHVINLADRADRRREVTAQLRRVGAAGDPRTIFFEAKRPLGPGAFPSVGSRGCYESHLAVVRQALSDGIERLLILEDDFDFARDIGQRGPPLMSVLASTPWDFFYGASVLDAEQDDLVREEENGLTKLSADIAVQTASCVGIKRSALLKLEPFLLAILGRPAGSPEYGPMHVDGAYSVFRRQRPELQTLAARPAIGAQRSSRSDIAANTLLLDRLAVTRPLANSLRRGLAWLNF